MGLYGGFSSKKLESEYNKFVQRFVLLVLDQLTLQLQLSNLIVNQTFFEEQFKSLLSAIKTLDEQKYSPPKYGKMAQAFEQFLYDFAASDRKGTALFSQRKQLELNQYLNQEDGVPQHSIDTQEYKTNFSRNEVSKRARFQRTVDNSEQRPTPFNHEEYLSRIQKHPIVGQYSTKIPRVCRKPGTPQRGTPSRGLEINSFNVLQNDQFIGSILKPWRTSKHSGSKNNSVLGQKYSPKENMSLPLSIMSSPVNLETQQQDRILFQKIQPH